MVYVTDPSRRSELIPRLKTLFANAEGIDHVYEPKDYAALGLPTPEQSDQSPDLFLAAKPDYAFANGEDEPFITNGNERGAHGYVNTDEKMRSIFIAWGAGIRSGAKLEPFPNVDVAPTIAALLGLKMNGIEGSPLTAILK